MRTAPRGSPKSASSPPKPRQNRAKTLARKPSKPCQNRVSEIADAVDRLRRGARARGPSGDGAREPDAHRQRASSRLANETHRAAPNAQAAVFHASAGRVVASARLAAAGGVPVAAGGPGFPSRRHQRAGQVRCVACLLRVRRASEAQPRPETEHGGRGTARPRVDAAVADAIQRSSLTGASDAAWGMRAMLEEGARRGCVR